VREHTHEQRLVASCSRLRTNADTFALVQRQVNVGRIVRDVVVIGASAGGISAIAELLSALPGDLPAMIGVVIHRGAKAPSDWSVSLSKHTLLQVVEPANGTLLRQCVVYVAPSDHHMTFRHNAVFLDQKPQEHHTRPAVNPLFDSAALAYGPRVLGILLTGGGVDGTKGLQSITAASGLSLVQSPGEAPNPSMPMHALVHDHVSAALSIDELASAIVALAHGRMFAF
jgi:two-component system chemotaxis response regulator CheB